MLLNKQSRGWGVETSWLSGCVTVITMLQNTISELQMITSPMRVWMCPLLLARASCWTNSPGAGDLKHHDAHVTSLRYKTQFRYCKWLSLQWKCVDASFAIRHDILLNKQSSDRGCETSWLSGCVTVITMLQNTISVLRLQMITSPMR